MARAKADGRRQTPETNKKAVLSAAGGDGSLPKPPGATKEMRVFFLLYLGSFCASFAAYVIASGFRVPELEGHPFLLLVAEPLFPTLGKINLHNCKSICNLLTAAFCGSEPRRNLPRSQELLCAF